MEVNKKEVGQRIRSIRQSKGMTMEEFGKLVNASKGNVSLWESGSSIPSNERLPLIVELSGKDMTVDELLHGVPLWERFDDEYTSEGKLSDDVKVYETFDKVYQADIGRMMQFLMEQLKTDNPNLTFNGEELNEEVRTMLHDSLDTTYKMFSKLVK